MIRFPTTRLLGTAGIALVAVAAGLLWLVRPPGDEAARESAKPAATRAPLARSEAPATRTQPAGPRKESAPPAKAAATLGARGEDPNTAAFLRAKDGWGLVEAGKYEQAIEAFREATRLMPEEPRFWVGLGLSQHRLYRDDLARPALERAIQLEPNVGQAHKLLGDIFFRAEDFERAAEFYEVARRQDPNDAGVHDRLLAARRYQEAEAGADRLFSAHFEVRFPGERYRAAAAEIGDRLEAAYRLIGQALGAFPGEPFTVVLYEDRQFHEFTASPHWAGGLFDGKIHLPVDRLMKERNAADGTVAHEYTHAVVQRLSGGRAPAWLNEGLAQFFEGDPRTDGDAELAPYQADLMPLRTLHGSFLDLPPAAARIAYAESREAVRALIDRYGLQRVGRILEMLAREPDFDRAFEAVVKERYADFDKDWLAAQTGRRHDA